MLPYYRMGDNVLIYLFLKDESTMAFVCLLHLLYVIVSLQRWTNHGSIFLGYTPFVFKNKMFGLVD
jgi:hypothetical protein